MKMMRFFGALLCVVMMLTVLPVSAAEATVIAAFEYSNEGAVVEANIEESGYGDKDKGYNSTTGDAELYASVNGTTYRKLEWTKDDYSGVGVVPAMTGGNNNPWGDGAYLEVQVPTVGYTDIAFSAELGATKKGPRDYQLQYSTDGKTFQNVGEVYAITDNKVMEKAFDNVALPADAAGAEMLYIRIAVASDETLGGEVTLAGSTGGETAINNIVVSGVAGKGVAASTGEATATDGGDKPLNVGVIVAVAAAVAAVVAVVIVIVLKKKKKA